MKYNKKGEMFLNWVLILIVGAVIIVFAVFFLQRITNVEEQKQDVLTQEYVDLLFNPFTTIGAVAEGYGKEFDFKSEVQIDFKCVNGEERIYSGKASGRKIENLVYSSDLQTKKLLVFTKPFELPFRIGDLIFAFDAEQEYCLISDSSSDFVVDAIFEDVEENLKNVKIERCDYNDAFCCNRLNNYKTISFVKGLVEDVNFYGQGLVSDTFAYGEIYFNGGTEEETGISEFIGLPLIEAAIFSDKEIYDCNFERLMNKVSLVADIYEKKAGYLQTDECQYSTIISYLDEMQRAANEKDMENLYAAAVKLEQANKGLACTQVY
ncbi:MAG: hypothetical protein KJ767_01085 [Nanoarchaeota archaeon]|nr:hypothetical protein [Nanoarchaeota archaeon]